MPTLRVNENKNESFHYTDGGLLLWLDWQVCWLRGVNLQVHCVGSPSEFFPSVRKDPAKEMQLAVDPQTGQVGGQILLHVLERLLAIARFGCYATRGGRPKKKIHTGASCFSSSLASVYFLNSFYIIEATHVPCIIPNKSIKMKIRICKPITQWQPCYFRGCVLICFGLLMHAHWFKKSPQGPWLLTFFHTQYPMY